MELISLVIMVLGLVALVAIYIISRMSRRHLPQKRDDNIPLLRDADGNETSSVLEDVVARDGKRPSANARNMSDAMMSGVSGRTPSNHDAPPEKAPAPQAHTLRWKTTWSESYPGRCAWSPSCRRDGLRWRRSQDPRILPPPLLGEPPGLSRLFPLAPPPRAPAWR